MAILDIILLLCFIPAIVTGISKGFVKQIVDFVAILAAAWAAFRFSKVMGEWLSQYVTLDVSILNVVSFVLVAVIVAILLHLIGALLTKTLQTLSLGFLNRLAGMLFGILKVGLILGLLILLFETLNSSLGIVKPEATANAVVYNALKNAANAIFPILKSFVTGGGETAVDAAATALLHV